MIWSIYLTLSLLCVPSVSEAEPDKRFLLDTFSHAVDSVGHILTDTVHSFGNAAVNIAGPLGNAAGTVLGAAGGLTVGVVTTGANLLIHKVDFISKAAVDVLNGGVDLASGVVHGINDIIDGILGHCFFFCSHHHRDRQVHPDVKCPASVVVTSDPGSDSKVVKLSAPVCSDPRGLPLKLSAQNMPGGNVFPEGSTTLRYTATNSHGLSSTCLVTVTVKVKRCAKPNYIENGIVSCVTSGGYMLMGETCTVTCEAGYQRRGARTLTCTDTDTLSSPTPVCEAVSCGQPPLLPTGQYDCPIGHVFESTCHLICPHGYTPAYRFYVTCQSNGKWTLPGQCASVSPPSFLHPNCTASVAYKPVSGSTNAGVTWNQVQVDPNKGVGKVTVTQTVGPAPGSVIGPGRHVIVYEAQDQTGSKATCYFSVDASRAARPCSPPSYHFKDSSLQFQCPKGYSQGSTCTVRCKPGYQWVHQGLAVDHSTVKCAKDPDTGVSWTRISPLPVCQSRMCPPLAVPDNGALSCDKWISGNMCQVQCQTGYTLPLSAPPNGMYACGQQSGTWRPNSYVLPCIASTLPLSFRAPGNMYYNGPCPTSSTARAEIRSNFIKTLSGSIFMSACADKTQCNTQNVDVICGKVTGKRDAAFAVQIKFDVVIPYSTANGGGLAAVMTSQTIMNKIEAGIASAIKSGHLSFPSHGLSAVSGVLHVDAISMDCPKGTAAQYTNGICAGCPKGQYYNMTKAACDDVPRGFYQSVDNSHTYTPCPSGMSTVTTGARNVSECHDLCPPGQYSPTGLAPCALCEKGTYSALPGQVTCLTCGAGLATMDLAATKAESCMDNNYLYSQCRSAPCANKGVCRDGGPDGYQCACQDGYTGRQCEIPPSHCASQPCLNNGTCISTNTSYTCVCPAGYKGLHCQLKIENGGWGSWSLWSPCSSSCGQGGRQSRLRHCDSPAPKNGGRDCQGDTTETAPCNQHQCPVCPTFPKPINTIATCNTVGQRHSCNMTCVPGYMFTHDPLPSYECGPSTLYRWNYETTTAGFLPACTEMAAPKNLSVKNTMSFSGLKCSLIGSNSNYHKELTNQIDQHTSKLACKEGGFCSSSTEVKCTAPDRDAVVELTLTAPGTSSIDIKDYFQNKQVSPELAKYLQTILAMELTGSQLQNYTSSLMSVNISNTRYTAVSHGVSSGVVCSTGSVYRDSACVKCSPGSMQVQNDCHLCEVNTYQPLEGQGQCQKCPQGHITMQTGSESSHDCIIGVKVTSAVQIVTPLPIQFMTKIIQIGRRGQA